MNGADVDQHARHAFIATNNLFLGEALGIVAQRTLVITTGVMNQSDTCFSFGPERSIVACKLQTHSVVIKGTREVCMAILKRGPANEGLCAQMVVIQLICEV